jgi:hypothetical protein
MYRIYDTSVKWGDWMLEPAGGGGEVKGEGKGEGEYG